jgi:hypothetical protein
LGAQIPLLAMPADSLSARANMGDVGRSGRVGDDPCGVVGNNGERLGVAAGSHLRIPPPATVGIEFGDSRSERPWARTGDA